MSDALVKDLEAVLEKHKAKPEPTAVVRWMPICEDYKTSGVASIMDYMGGDTIMGRHGRRIKVLKWVMFRIDAANPFTVDILSVRTPVTDDLTYVRGK